MFVGDITGEGVAQRSTLGLGTLMVLAAAGLLGSLGSCWGAALLVRCSSAASFSLLSSKGI